MALLSQLHDQRGSLDQEFGSAYFVFIAPVDPALCKALDVWHWVKQKRQPPYTLFSPEMDLDVYLIEHAHIAELEQGGEVIMKRMADMLLR